MSRTPITGFDVEGPVQAEVFVTGPCGAASWFLEVGADEDPLAVVAAALDRALGAPLVFHSTSWRRSRGGVVLTFIAVIDGSQVGSMASVPVARASLARNTATAAPASMATAQVIEHGLRHLAWLVRDDPVVGARLAGDWATVLHGYAAEPFRHLR